jgi:ketosteroid isomerase-like protein
MNDAQIRELANRFFDAYQDRRPDELKDIYCDETIVWTNVFQKEMAGADNIAALPASYAKARRRTYDDRTINTFDEGFVIQYTLTGVHHTGHKGALSVCIVALCRNNKIVRIDEYMDTSKFREWRGPNFHEDG